MLRRRVRRINYSPRPTNLIRVKFERVLKIIAQNLADKAASAINLNGKSGKFSRVASG